MKSGRNFKDLKELDSFCLKPLNSYHKNYLSEIKNVIRQILNKNYRSGTCVFEESIRQNFKDFDGFAARQLDSFQARFDNY